MKNAIRNARSKNFFDLLIFIGFLLSPITSSAAPVNYLPTPYVQKSDSPFLVGNGGPFTVGASNFFLDDFEDGALNLLGVSETSGNPVRFLSGTIYTDSVDEDDGAVDGNGINGTSLISEFHSAASEPSLAFSFDSNVLGKLPTHVGFVVTGLNGDRIMEFSAFDETNALISSFQFEVLVQDNGRVEEDRFIGISDFGGISRVELAHVSNAGDQVEIDHFQYGLSAVPVPAAAWLFGSGLLGLVGITKRKKA